MLIHRPRVNACGTVHDRVARLSAILLEVGHPKPDGLMPVDGGIKKPLSQIAPWPDGD